MMIADAEIERYPDLGSTRGDFRGIFKDQYRNYRWERIVQESGAFPDVRKVKVVVFFGPRMTRTYSLTEFLHSPLPPPDLGAD
jgi:hypothetical protein